MKNLVLFLLFIPLLSIPISCTEQEPFMYPETEPKMPETYSKILFTASELFPKRLIWFWSDETIEI